MATDAADGMTPAAAGGGNGEVGRLRRRLEREVRARRSAEEIAERAIADLYQRHREIDLLRRIAVAANSATTVEEAFRTVVDLVCDHTGWPIGHVYLVVGDRLEPSAVWHLADSERHRDFREVTEAMTLARGVGLPGRVAETGSPAWIVDLGRDGNFPRELGAAACGVVSGFAFPIRAGEEIVAIAEFFSPTPTEPDPALLALVENVGTQLGRVFERKRTERRLIHDAMHDALTGLPNRALFVDRLGQALARGRRSPAPGASPPGFAVMFVDADRFKVVNDSLGHLAGDELLIAVGRRLGAGVRQVDTLARLGGDEFALLLADVDSPRDAIVVAERIRRAMAAPFQIEGQEVFVTVSIGIVLSTPAHQQPSDFLRDADTALYRAKAGGRARHEIFDASMHARALTLLRLESDLRRAVDRRELFLVYQPIVELVDGRLTGFEALVRWRHPERGVVSPAEFIPLAEETGLIVPIGAWVLEEACRQLAAWQHLGDGRATVSVNLAARQFAEPGLVAEVARCAAVAGLPLSRLKLELTESSVIAHPGAEAVLADLDRLGVGLKLDDFGTGYSSLAHLHRFPISTIKIDRSFVMRMVAGDPQHEIVRAIVVLARTLGMDVVAEGVETEAQRAALLALGCPRAQGYLFARPLDAAAAEALLRDGPARLPA